MAGAKEVRSKIASIKNTQKVTGAMEMLSASKMKKAQDRMRSSRPYSEKIRNVISHLAASSPDEPSVFMIDRPIKRVGYIVISTDRGLCGGLNTNLFKMLVADMKRWKENGVEIDLSVVGRKAEAFFRRWGGNVVSHVDRLGDQPNLNAIIGVIKVMLDAFLEGKIDAVFLAHNHFVNTMTQQPVVSQLIPLKVSDEQTGARAHPWDYVYESGAQTLLNLFIERYVESQVYQGLVENTACEQAARMVAMKNASENAQQIIYELQLVYNKARQAAITKELAEIVSGAEAV